MKPRSTFAKSTSDRLTTVLSYGTLLLLIYLVYLITAPFLVPLAWSAVLAISFYPLHQRIEKSMKPTQAALLSTVLVTLVLIVPAIVVLILATRQAIDASTRIQTTLMDSGPGFADACSGLGSRASSGGVAIGGFLAAHSQGAERIATFLAGKHRRAGEEPGRHFFWICSS